MTIGGLFAALGVDVLCDAGLDREISRATVGDLLSHVMGGAPEGALWVTIISHVNVAAVAVLKDIPAVILACGREAHPDLLARCRSEGIALAAARESAFSICGRLWELGLRG